MGKHERDGRQRPAGTHGEPSGVLPQLPLGSNAFRSPLLAPAAQRRRGPYRAALAIVSGSMLVSVGLVSAALFSRTNEVSVGADPDRIPRGSLLPAARAARQPAFTANPAPTTAPLSAAGALAPPPAAASRESMGAVLQPRLASAAASSQRRAVRRRPVREPALRVESKLAQTPTRSDVIGAMARIKPAVQACFGESHGVAKVSFFVRGKTGRVTTARVQGVIGKAGSCIARAVRRARFPKFAKDRIEISYPFQR